jgi:hypothetical protein
VFASARLKGKQPRVANMLVEDHLRPAAVKAGELQKRLPDTDIKTCEDFRHLNVTCCNTCHTFYPHYEMSLIDLPGGAKAWVCDPVKWAIYPDQYQELQEWKQNSPEGKLLRRIFGEDAVK